MNRTLHEFIIGQAFDIAEKLKVGFGFCGAPIVISKRWIESTGGGAVAVFPFVLEDIFMKVLPDVIVDGIGLSIRVVVVAKSYNEIRVPTFNEIRYIQKRLTRQPVIANNGKGDLVALRAGRLIGLYDYETEKDSK